MSVYDSRVFSLPAYRDTCFSSIFPASQFLPSINCFAIYFIESIYVIKYSDFAF